MLPFALLQSLINLIRVSGLKLDMQLMCFLLSLGVPLQCFRPVIELDVIDSPCEGGAH
jgi:hypothetical protein